MSAGLRLFQPWSRALQLGLALCLSTSIPAMAEGRAAFAEAEAEALSKLSRQQRHRYFDDLRALQRRRFDQRQAVAQRMQWKQELRALRERYNLPLMHQRTPDRQWR